MRKKINFKIIITALIAAAFVFLPECFAKADTCQNDCSSYGQHECYLTSGRSCGNYDADSCLEFSQWKSCDIQCYFCGDKTCNSNCGENSSNCLIDCKDPNALPSVDAGKNIDTWSGNSVVFNATASDPEGEVLVYLWTCNGGVLSDKNVLQPTYFAPEVTKDTNYTCTLTVSDYRGGTKSDSLSIKVKKRISTLTLLKTARNITQGQSSWQKVISAIPSDKIELKIEMTAISDTSNILITEFLPKEITYKGNLKIDGVSASGDPIKILQIGDLKKDKSKVITFEAEVLPANNFTLGSTALAAITQARANLMLETSDNSTVNVIKTSNQFIPSGTTAGSAQDSGKSPTDVNTGFTNRILDSFLLPLIISFLIIWAFKSRIIWLDSLIESRKEKIRKFQTIITLKNKIKHIRTHEKEIYETWKR